MPTTADSQPVETIQSNLEPVGNDRKTESKAMPRPRSRRRQNRPNKVVERICRQHLDDELRRLCTAALMASPERLLPVEQLHDEVVVAYEMANNLPESIDDLLSALRIAGSEDEPSSFSEFTDDGFSTDDGPPPAAARAASSTSDSDANTTQNALIRGGPFASLARTDVEAILAEMPIVYKGLRKFLKGFQPTIRAANELWKFDLSKSPPYTAYLEPAIATPQIDDVQPLSKKERKKLGVGKKQSVSEQQLEIAKLARDITDERRKLTSEGRYVAPTKEENKRPPDLSAGALRALGAELRQAYQALIPLPDGDLSRTKFLKKLQNIIDYHYRNLGIRAQLFGSSVNTLGFSASDVDVILELPQDHKLSPEELQDCTNMYRMARVLRRSGMQNVVPIAGARVPICKFYDPHSKLHCDLNFGNVLGAHNSRLLRTYTLVDPRIRALIMLLKQWAKNRDINDAADGGTISSYAYSLMILNYLQTLNVIPSLQMLFDGPTRRVLNIRKVEHISRGAWKRNQKAKKNQQSNGAPAEAPKQSTEVSNGQAPKGSPVEDGDEDGEDEIVESMAEDTEVEEPPNGFKADVSFLEDLSHPALAPFKTRWSGLTPEDLWGGPEGIASFLYGFLRYYGWDFRYRVDQVISVRLGKVLDTVTPDLEHWKKKTGMVLIVEDPFQLDRNCTGVVTEPGKVVKEMRRAVQLLHMIVDSGENAKAILTEMLEETAYVRNKRESEAKLQGNRNNFEQGGAGRGRGRGRGGVLTSGATRPENRFNPQRESWPSLPGTAKRGEDKGTPIARPAWQEPRPRPSWPRGGGGQSQSHGNYGQGTRQGHPSHVAAQGQVRRQETTSIAHRESTKTAQQHQAVDGPTQKAQSASRGLHVQQLSNAAKNRALTAPVQPSNQDQPRVRISSAQKHLPNHQERNDAGHDSKKHGGKQQQHPTGEKAEQSASHVQPKKEAASQEKQHSLAKRPSQEFVSAAQAYGQNQYEKKEARLDHTIPAQEHPKSKPQPQRSASAANDKGQPQQSVQHQQPRAKGSASAHQNVSGGQQPLKEATSKRAPSNQQIHGVPNAQHTQKITEKGTNRQVSRSGIRRTTKEDMQCFHCQGMGHFKADCKAQCSRPRCKCKA